MLPRTGGVAPFKCYLTNLPVSAVGVLCLFFLIAEDIVSTFLIDVFFLGSQFHIKFTYFIVINLFSRLKVSSNPDS